MADDLSSLKRLEFVKSYGSYVTSTAEVAEKVYKTARSFTPSLAESYVAGVEDRVVAYAAPLLTAVQDQADKTLRNVDTQLDTTVSKLWGAYESGRNVVVDKATAVQETNAKVYTTARDTYLKTVEQALDVVNKQRESLSSAAQAATDSVKSAVDFARDSTEKSTETALNTVIDTWSYLLSFPAVAKVLETSAPAVEMAKKYYLSAHSVIVADPKYKFLYSTSISIANKVLDTSLYKRGQDLVYPLVSPVASPVLKKVTSSPYYTQLLEQLKPVEPAK